MSRNEQQPRTLSFLPTALALAASLVGLCTEALADERLDRAKEKGTLSWYNVVYPEELRTELMSSFEEKTGIKVESYVGGTGQIISRIKTERQTGSYGVDVVSISDKDILDGFIKEKILRPYEPAEKDRIVEIYRDPQGHWYGFYAWALSLQYNTQLLDEKELPLTWEGLADPKWKGKVAISDPARSGAGLAFLKSVVHDYGWDWVERFMANEPLVVTVGPGVDQAVVSGERVVGTTVSSYVSETLKAEGPAKLGSDEHLLVTPVVAGIVPEAPNPAAAELFVDYLLSAEAGKLYVKYGWFSTRSDVTGPFGYPAADKLQVRHPTIPSVGERDELLKKFDTLR